MARKTITDIAKLKLLDGDDTRGVVTITQNGDAITMTNTDDDSAIRYRLDGREPMMSDTIYTGPLSLAAIGNPSIIRARGFGWQYAMTDPATLSNVCAPPAITSTPPATYRTGQAYVYQAVATGSAPIVWALTAGPAGAAVDTITGLVTWTPPVIAGGVPVVEISNSCGHHFSFSTSPAIAFSFLTACPSGITSWLSGPGWGRKFQYAFPAIADIDFVVSGDALYPAGTDGPGAANLPALSLHVGWRRASDGAYVQTATLTLPAQLWYDNYAGPLWRVQYAAATDTWTLTQLA